MAPKKGKKGSRRPGYGTKKVGKGKTMSRPANRPVLMNKKPRRTKPLPKDDAVLQKKITKEGLNKKGDVPQGNIALKKRKELLFQGKNKVLRKRKPKQAKAKDEEEEDTPGIIYLSNLPHGFFRKQMGIFFKQFGKVNHSRLVCSPKTGKSCGYGYVEFTNEVVARIAAESMNNYLTFGKIIKCKFLGYNEGKSEKIFSQKSFGPKTCPKVLSRDEAITRLNAERNPHQIERRTRRVMVDFNKKIKKLQALGVKVDVQLNIGNLKRKVRQRKVKAAKEEEEPEKAKAEGVKKESETVEAEGDKKSQIDSKKKIVKTNIKKEVGDVKEKAGKKKIVKKNTEKEEGDVKEKAGKKNIKKKEGDVKEKAGKKKIVKKNTKKEEGDVKEKAGKKKTVKRSTEKEEDDVEEKAGKKKKVEKNTKKEENDVLVDPSVNNTGISSEGKDVVFEADQSDDEIVLKTPPFARKKLVKITPTSPAVKLRLIGISKSKSGKSPSNKKVSTKATADATPKSRKASSRPTPSKGTPKANRVGTPKANRVGTPKANRVQANENQSSAKKSANKKRRMSVIGTDENCALSGKQKRLSL